MTLTTITKLHGLLIISICLFLAIMTLKIRQEHPSFKKIYNDNQAAIFLLGTEYKVTPINIPRETLPITGNGTGFFITKDGVAITATHVLFPWKYKKQYLMAEEMGIAKVYQDSWKISIWVTSEKTGDDPILIGNFGIDDIEILQVGDVVIETMYGRSPIGLLMYKGINEEESSDFTIFRIKNLEKEMSFIPVPMETIKLEPLDQVMVIGYPLVSSFKKIQFPHPTIGRVRRYTINTLEVDIAMHSGSSGSPLFNKYGILVGLGTALLGGDSNYSVFERLRNIQKSWLVPPVKIEEEMGNVF